VLSISASCLASAAVCRIKFGKLEMEVILNATLAGGVSVGSASDLVVTAGVAMAIGTLAGIVSSLGFIYFGEWLSKKINLQDTCGVHNLHGMPGVLGGCIGAFSAGFADLAFENDNSALLATFKALKDGRTVQEQGWFQLAALGVTLAISIGSGALCGWIASHVGKSGDGDFNLFTDDGHWVVHDGDKIGDIDYNLGETVEHVELPAIENKVVDEPEEKKEEKSES